MGYGARIKKLRVEAGLTQEEMANKTGCTRSAIASWETERREPDIPTFQHLAEFFNVPTEYVMGISKEGGKANKPPANDEVNEILETLHKRPEMKTLFSITKKATRDDIEKAMRIIEALKDE